MNFPRLLRWSVGVFLVFSSPLIEAQTATFTTTTIHFDEAGGTATFDIVFDYTGQSLGGLGVRIVLPAGWSYASASGPNVPQIEPSSGDMGAITFAYSSIPPNSISYSVTVNYPSDLTADQVVSGDLFYRISGSPERVVALGPITISKLRPPLFFSEQPSSVSVDKGDPVSFSVSVPGSPTPLLQWQKDGVNILGATTSVYTLPQVSFADSGIYTVVASNGQESITSALATLSINSKARLLPASTTYSPIGGTITFDLSFDYSGEVLSALGAFLSLPSGWTYAEVSGANIPPVISDGSSFGYVEFAYFSIPADGINFSFTLNYPAGLTTYQNISGSVPYKISGDSAQHIAALGPVVISQYLGPTFIAQPESVAVLESESFSFSASVTGTPDPTLQWQKDGVDIIGATSSTYTVSAAVSTDAGIYTLIATNNAGVVASSQSTLKIGFDHQFSSASTTYSMAGGTITFDISYDFPGRTLPTLSIDLNLPSEWSYVSASGDNLPSYLPRIGAVGTAEFSYSYPSDRINFSATFSYPPGQAADQMVSGTIVYRIEINDPFSYATLGQITIMGSPTPTFITQPQSANVNEGESVSFFATVAGVPFPIFQWQKDGLDINGATSSIYTITEVSAADVGSYTLVATNSVGSVSSESAQITAQAAPQITAQPIGITIAAGQPLRLFVTADGLPEPVYQWRLDGVEIPGETAAELNRSAVSADDSGSYDVVVSNDVGSLNSDAAEVVVESSPSIVTPPVGGAFVVGSSVELSVAVNGTPPFTYSWSKNGGPVSGASSSTLALANLSITDSGDYRVTISNEIGTVQSQSVPLAVVELAGVHSYAGSGYRAGKILTIHNSITYDGALVGFGWTVLPPEAIEGQSWTFAANAGNAGEVAPLVGDTDLFEWAWTSVPASPIEFSYTLDVPANVVDDQLLIGVLQARFEGAAVLTMVHPDPLLVPAAPSNHDADTDQNNQFSLGELLRVIELYNVRNGTVRTGRYRLHPGAEDGYETDPETTRGTVSQLTRHHSADTDINAELSLGELLRVIELYNYRDGTRRTGTYHAELLTVDGFATGPED